MSKTPIEEQREALHDILLGVPGIKKVYYQPPYSQQLVYPCIIYSYNRLNTKYASDGRYLSFPSYTLTLIDHDPECSIQKNILDLPKPCNVAFDRHFVSDNLYHWIYTLIFSRLLW